MSLDQITGGNRLGLSRLLTEVENGTEAGVNALDQLFTKTGRAHLVGITGAPGTGKSSLVNSLTKHLRHEYHKRVAIVAVDPSSPFSGGAILGDRVRMRELAGDHGVFIRSMASRGALGGLARSTAGVVEVLDAAGFELILIETVGAGQGEVDIARLAHTTIVVEAPGLGDDIQAIKAGILEIADVLVINKADLSGVEITERALRANLELGNPVLKDHDEFHNSSIMPQGEHQDGWLPRVLKTIAIRDEGTAEVAAAIFDHQTYLQTSGSWQQRDQERLRNEMIALLQETLIQHWRNTIKKEDYEQAMQQVFARKMSPSQAIHSLIGDVKAL